MTAPTPTDSQTQGEPPYCSPPDPHPRKPAFQLPALACDSHAHVCGPAARFPYSAQRIYTPPDALPATYRSLLDTLGVARAVLVQPSFYAADNRALLAALATDPARLRGVAVIEPGIGGEELERMHEAGVRGIRCNIVDLKDGKGQLPLEMLGALAEQVKPFGWHLEFLLHVDEFPDLDRLLAGFPVDVVFGHLGYIKTAKGLETPGFQALLRLLKDGRAWVKLTGPYRISSGLMPYADVTPFAHALTDAAPKRLVWGSDWPHVALPGAIKGPMPNDGDLCSLLADWVPDEALRRKILVDNPEQLYGF